MSGVFVLDVEFDRAGTGGFVGVVGEMHEVVDESDGAGAGKVGFVQGQSSLAEGESEIARAAEEGDVTAEEAGGAGDLGTGGQNGVELEVLEMSLEQGLVDVACRVL